MGKRITKTQEQAAPTSTVITWVYCPVPEGQVQRMQDGRPYPGHCPHQQDKLCPATDHILSFYRRNGYRVQVAEIERGYQGMIFFVNTRWAD